MGDSWGSQPAPLPPQPLPSEMTPKYGQIDVYYAYCSYHTRIGLGKWSLDATMINLTTGLPFS